VAHPVQDVDKKNEPIGSCCLELRIAGSMKKISFIKTDSKDVCNYPVRQFRNDLIKRLIKYDIIYS
jgi:hypothetical protein